MKQKPFQGRVEEWLRACFGDGTSATSVRERSFRFIEEALELGQSCGMTKGEALQLVDYVYGRPVGEPAQEVGGTLITLSSLCSTQAIDMEHAADIELARCWRNIGKIRAKQASKPQDTPLPGATPREQLASQPSPSNTGS
jgi:hypothetical protein